MKQLTKLSFQFITPSDFIDEFPLEGIDIWI